MLKCRKSIFFFAFLFIIISVGVMALSDGLVNREEIRMAELEKQQLQTPSTSSDISETALGQAQDAAVQAKIEMEAAIKAKIAMEEEANRGAEKQANFPSLKAKGGVAIQKSEFGYTTLGARPDFLKEEYNGPANVVDMEMISRQGGDDIASAAVVGGLPFSSSGTTSGYNDDYDEACPYTGSTSPDVVYSYTPSANISVDISLCVGSAYDTKLYVYENSVTAGSPYACNDDACPGYVSELLGVALTGGNTYYIVIDGYGGAFGDYTIDINENAPPPPFDCPVSSFDENEACGSDANGGCNMATPTFEAIACGDTVCGTAWADGGTRDTDWYELTLTSTGTITMSGSAEFPFVLGVIDTADCNLVSSIDPYALGNPGETVSVSRVAGPGTYWLFVGQQGFYDYPCGSATGYWASIECEAPSAPANDDCANAEVVGDVVNLPYSTDLATFDGVGTCNTAPNIWYSYTASCDGDLTVSLCGSSYDTKLAVYEGTSCDPLGVEVGCNDDLCGLQSEVAFTTTAGSTYLIEVGGYSAATGNGLLSISCGAACAECPVGGIPEGEACIADDAEDNFNGGCNSTPAVFST
ncbi:MAG: hypothetical protein ACE5D6_02590, partial [Candidatus Zixiibacteriota bacterium]